MSFSTSQRRTAALLSAAALSLGLAMPAAGATDSDRPDLTPVDTTVPTNPDTRVVLPDYDPKALEIMARSSGRSVAEQRRHLARQTGQNNAYATLRAEGLDFDGAFFAEDNTLVVQASAGSPAAQQARAAGLRVRTPKHGEQALLRIQAELDALPASRQGIAAYGPDLQQDAVVVTVSGPIAEADQAFLWAARKHGDAVRVVRGKPNEITATVRGGDEIIGAGYCSAGFPARTGSGYRVMIWVGHCVEGSSTFRNTWGTRVATAAASAFRSYDGQPDRDIGALWMDDEDTMSFAVNRWGTSGLIGNAGNGAWKAPVGTDLCKSGRTTGVTCGRVQGYNQTVTYTDNQGRAQASVSGLGQTSVCVQGGDSGGAYTSGGYAVAMTSGGPSNQSCTYNGGYQAGSSYVQPVTDALNYYGLNYG